MVPFRASFRRDSPTSRQASCIAILVGFVCAGPANAAYFLVKPDGTGLFPTIQAAIDAASAGDVIELANGVFRGVGNQDIDFRGKAIRVCSQMGSRDLCVLDVGSQGSTPHRLFLFQNQESSDSVVENLTLRGGNASGSTGTTGSGGAVLCLDDSNPTFLNCNFVDNYAARDGGAVSCREASPTFVNCRFEDNASPFGGAIFTDRPCLLTVAGQGAPVLRLEQCQFVGNQANEGGAIYARGIHTNLALDQCGLSSNFADYGGAMKLHGARATIDQCSIEENWGGSEGGGFVFESTVFCDPIAPPYGGEDPVEVTVSNSLIRRNYSGSGGGALVRGYSVSFTGCTVVENGASSGSGVYVRSQYTSDPYLPSLALLDRTIVAFGFEGASVFKDSASVVRFTCTDIFGNAGGDWVEEIADQLGVDGNLAADPLFCDPDNGDYGLMGDSPCQEYPGGCGLIGAFPASCAASSVSDEGIGKGSAIAAPVRLQIRGNPFVSTIKANIATEIAGQVELELLDVTGRRVAAHDLGRLEVGEHRIVWSPSPEVLPAGSGVYFLRAIVGGESVSHKLTCLR